MARFSTDEQPEAPHDAPPPEPKLSARDKWLLLALLLLTLCVGMGLGAGLGRQLELSRPATAPAKDCGVLHARADSTASVSAASIRLDPTQSAETSGGTTSSESSRASDSASSVRLPGLHRAITTNPAHKPRTLSPADARPDAGAPSPTLGPDLHEALRLLRAAQRALRAADATRALSVLDRMARRAPDALALEREVTRVLAYCAANDVDNARLTAAALHASDEASVYAHRLSKSCVGPAPAPASLLHEMRQRALN